MKEERLPTTQINNSIVPSYARHNSIDSMLKEAEILIKSSLVPFKKAEDVVIVMQAAQDLQMPITYALANLYVIQGRISSGIHIIEGLLTRGGVIIECVDDFTPVNHYVSTGGARLVLSGQEVITKVQNGFKVMTAEQAKENALQGSSIIPLVQIPAPYINIKGEFDKRTTVKMTRMIKQIDGSYKELVQTASYYLHEAYQAGYLGTGDDKDNWLNHTRSMLYARCTSRLGKRIASDLLFGMNELSELADTFDVPYEVVEENGITTTVMPK